MAAVLTNPTCNEYNNGSINITISGGTTPYLYSWSNGQGIQDATELTAGTYYVTVTDGNDCQIVGGPYVLTEPAAVTIAVSGIVNTQCNASVGQVVLTSSDGSTITLNGVTQGSGTTWTGLAAGYYTATSNGTCPASVSFNIINTNSTLAATVSVANPLCNGGAVT
ncbi:SprB repeat-containing protein, partial [Arthrospira platensis SPKY1]|nr:SprB repeat-containing protein [Arthrospira platensis SPKY1]